MTDRTETITVEDGDAAPIDRTGSVAAALALFLIALVILIWALRAIFTGL